MEFSNSGLALVKKLEGFRARAYPDSGGKMTIGYGHLIVPGDGVPPGDIIDPVKGTELLIRDVQQAVDCVNSCVKVDLDQTQFDALVIFTFNVGCSAFKHSTLLTMINAKNMVGATPQFLRWDMAGGNHIPGLHNRRVAEQTLFTTGVYTEA